MKFDLTQKLLDLDGSILISNVVGFDEKGNQKLIRAEELSFWKVIVVSLNASVPNERTDREDVSKRYDLIVKVLNNKKEIELKTDEITYIKDCVAKAGIYSPLVFGQVDRLLEGKDSGINPSVEEVDMVKIAKGKLNEPMMPSVKLPKDDV